MRCLIPALAASLLAAPACADQLPNLVPAHDLTGSYLVTGKDGPKTVTVEYSKAANVLRLTPQDGAGYLLYDFAAKDAKMVLPQMQRYMEQPSVASRIASMQAPTNGNNVSIAKAGTETIAGHDCTDYTATNKTKGTSATLCVTDDSVLLKLTSTDGNSIVAQSVSYSAVPAADVTVPPGYMKFEMPQMPAGTSGMGNMPMPGAPPP